MMLNKLIITIYKLICILLLFLLGLKAVAIGRGDTRPYELATINKKLNDTYQKILHRLEPSEQEKLKKAERAWIVFRDLDCAWAESAEPLDCLMNRTENREKELRNTLFDDINNNYSSIQLDESEHLNKDKK